MAVQLIASDIDGTFLNDDHTFDHARFQNQLDQMNDRGIRFVVASGNQLQHCEDVFAGIEGDFTYVAENGALIVEAGQVLDESPIKKPLVKDTLDYLNSLPNADKLVVLMSGKNGAYTNLPLGHPEWELLRYFYKDVQYIENIYDVNDSVYKLDIHWDGLEDVRDKAQVIRQDLGTNLGNFMSGFSGIDIVMPHVTKAYGLQQLQNIWKISMDETMAFGDNQNDEAMLQHARLGYAMKNAAPEALAATQLVTDLSNNDSGVLDMIDKVLVGSLK